MIVYIITDKGDAARRGGGFQGHKVTLEDLSGDVCLVLHYTQVSLSLMAELRPWAVCHSGGGTSYRDYDVLQTRAYRRAVTQGHGWYGFGLDVEATRKRVSALQDVAKTSPRPKELGPLEISVTPPGYDVPDKATIEAYAAAGVHRLILRLPPQMDAPALERFVAETGRALGLKV